MAQILVWEWFRFFPTKIKLKLFVQPYEPKNKELNMLGMIEAEKAFAQREQSLAKRKSEREMLTW